MLSKSFKPAKCKTSLKLAVARMKLLKNKRDVTLKQMKRDLAQLLDSGQEQTARIRVEHVVREEKTTAAYEIIELYCELLVARLPIIESQKNCPIDLKEAIASIIFAAPRCADVPELQDIRKHLTAKYGKDFAAAALELRPDCGVSRTVVEKLSAKTPDGVTKIKILTAIAQDHNVNWDPQSLKEEVAKPAEDLLKVPSRPENFAKTSVESTNVQYHDSEGQFKSSNERFLARPEKNLNLSSAFAGNDGKGSSPDPSSFSFQDSKPPSSSAHSSYSQGGYPESKIASGGMKSSSHVGDNNSADGKNWNMGFTDATSAARVAAESAELASLAARAAAELSSRGKHSNEKKLTRDEISPTSRTPMSSTAQGSFKRSGDPAVYHAEEISDGRGQQRDEKNWHNLSEGSDRRYGFTENRNNSSMKSGLSPPTDMYPNDEDPPKTRKKPISTQSSLKKSRDPEVYHVRENLKKNDRERDEINRSNLSHEGVSKSVVMQSRNNNVKESVFSRPADMFVNYNNEPSISSPEAEESYRDINAGSSRKDYGLGDANVYFDRVNSSPSSIIKDYDGDSEVNSRGLFREKGIGRSSKRSSNEYSAVVFDNSGSESEEKLDLEYGDGVDPFSADISTDRGYLLSHSGSWNFKEQNASPLTSRSTGNFGSKTENPDQSLKNLDHSQQGDFPVATFDDSDDLLHSSSDEEVDIRNIEERNKIGTHSHKLDKSDRSIPSSGSLHEPTKSVLENKESKEADRIIHDLSFDDSDSEIDGVDIGLKLDSVKSLRKRASGDIVRERPHFDDAKDMYDEAADEMKALNASSGDNEIRLNLGRLTGGLRHKNLSHPPYVKNSSKRSTIDKTSVESQSADFGGRRSESVEVPLTGELSRSRKEFTREARQGTGDKIYGEIDAIDSRGRSLNYSKGPVLQPSSGNPPKEVIKELKQGPVDRSYVERQSVNFGGRTARQSKAPVVQQSSGKSREDVVKEPKVKKSIDYFDSDSDDDKKQEPPKALNSKANNDNTFSRRTKGFTPKAESASPLRFTSQSRSQHENSVEENSISEYKTNAVRHQGRGERLTDGNVSVEQLSKSPSSEDPTSVFKELVKPNTPKREFPRILKQSNLKDESSSIDNSPKTSGRVHPKLPDYDTLAARIQSLTSNRR